MDPIRENEIDSVPNPIQAKRAPTAKRNDTPTHKNHRRIVSTGNEEIGNGLAESDWTTLPDSADDGAIVRAGTFAMGFTNRIPLLNPMQPTAQTIHSTKKRAIAESP